MSKPINVTLNLSLLDFEAFRELHAVSLSSLERSVEILRLADPSDPQWCFIRDHYIRVVENTIATEKILVGDTEPPPLLKLIVQRQVEKAFAEAGYGVNWPSPEKLS